MAKQLPPLNQLRAFEAAARHLSFSKAADELCVTPAAISHHIRTLEIRLNCRLFQRLTRRLELTKHGVVLFPVVKESFDNIATAVRRLSNDLARPQLSVRMPPFLSARWLTPRLGNFVSNYPGIQLHLEHATRPVDFRTDQVDIAVQWAVAGGSGISSEPFLPTQRVAMCNKRLLTKKSRTKRPEDIAQLNLLHEFSYADWEQWFEMHGLDPAKARRGIVVDNYEVLLRAVAEGQGIALLMSCRFGNQLDDAQLIAPFGLGGPDFAYYILYPNGALAKPMVHAFRQWLFDEVRTSVPQ